MSTNEGTQFAATATNITPNVEEGQNRFVLVYPTSGNAKEECNLWWREDEITRAVTGALVPNKNHCVFRHQSPIKPARILQPELGRSSGLPMCVIPHCFKWRTGVGAILYRIDMQAGEPGGRLDEERVLRCFSRFQNAGLHQHICVKVDLRSQTS